MADNVSPALLPLFRIGYGKEWNWELARKGGKIEDEEQHMHLSNWPIGRRVLQRKGTCDMDAPVGVMGRDEGGYGCLETEVKVEVEDDEAVSRRTESKGRKGRMTAVCVVFSPCLFLFDSGCERMGLFDFRFGYLYPNAWS